MVCSSHIGLQDSGKMTPAPMAHVPSERTYDQFDQKSCNGLRYQAFQLAASLTLSIDLQTILAQVLSIHPAVRKSILGHYRK